MNFKSQILPSAEYVSILCTCRVTPDTLHPRPTVGVCMSFYVQYDAHTFKAYRRGQTAKNNLSV